MQDAQVDYRVYRQRTGFLGDLGASAAGGFRHEYYGYYQGQELYWQEFVTSGTARTDSSGKVHLSFKAPLSSYGDGNYVYMLVADVTDSTGKVASGSGSVLVAGGTFDAQVVADRWIVSPNQEFSVKVLTVTSDGSPASRQLALDVLRRRWHKDGYTDTPVSRMDVSTSARGEAAVGVTVPEAGSTSYWRPAPTSAATAWRPPRGYGPPAARAACARSVPTWCWWSTGSGTA